MQLRFVDGLTQSQIAAEIGVSQMHVSRLLRRALEKLGEEIEDAVRGDGTHPGGRAATRSSCAWPPRAENLALARLALAGVGAVAGASETSVADLKLAVTEACTNAILHALPGRHRPRSSSSSATGSPRRRSRSRSRTTASASTRTTLAEPRAPGPDGQGMGLMIIRAVTDDVAIESDATGSRISFSKRLARA